MRSLFAALRSLGLPFGVSTGPRILLDGVNGRIIMYDANNVAVINESPDGIVLTSTGGFIDLDPSVGGVPFDVTQIRFGSGTRDVAIIEGTHFDVDAMALQFSSGVRTGVGYSRLQLRVDAVNLFADDNAGDTNGILLTPDSSTVNEPWTIQGETWHNAVLQNAWTTVGVTAFYDPAYTLSADGATVKLSGVMANGATAAGTVVFNVPAAYRPAQRVQLPVTLNAGTALTAVIQVMEVGAANAGDVKIYGVPAGNAVGLDNLWYRLS